eukprot:scaffold4071_cov217-Isochrysis_galbana.AAC.2
MSRRARANSRRSIWMASDSAVRPVASRSFRSAPDKASLTASSKRPLRTASITGVLPCWSRPSGPGPDGEATHAIVRCAIGCRSTSTCQGRELYFCGLMLWV